MPFAMASSQKSKAYCRLNRRGPATTDIILDFEFRSCFNHVYTLSNNKNPTLHYLLQSFFGFSSELDRWCFSNLRKLESIVAAVIVGQYMIRIDSDRGGGFAGGETERR